MSLETSLSPQRLVLFLSEIFSAILFFLFLREASLLFIKQKRRFTKPVNLPVVNLDGNNYRAAEESYVTDLITLLKEGREKGVMGDKFFVDVIRPEIPATLKTSLNPKLDWRPFHVYPKCLRMISLISGRIFVGPDLNRDEKWITTNIDFTIDLFRGGEAVRRLPQLLRSAAINLRLVPKVNRMWDQERYAMRVLIPILKQRIKEQTEDPDMDRPKDMLQWIMEYSRSVNPPLSLERQAKTQLILGMSAIHASSIATVNFIYDLMARPEYLKPLREEVDRVWEESNGELDKPAMSKLVKLDSFLKESQRLHPAAHITFDREITNKKGFTLSNGLHLPQHTHYAVASSLIAKNSEPWQNPEEFDGLRCAKLRENPADHSKFHFVSTNPYHSMAFSHGKHACPGRFFAANEIKTIMAYMIRHFDMKPVQGKEKRPESVVFGHNLQPDPSVEILIRKRQEW
ncbi:hypothetical protein H2200_013055 [Cladophialophora chaetospira]|uniref:Cytochrome P450 n=1 Tax=Cladophialophora chaetospira TaxID=386627 RepID=A0AA39CBS8_9EURO|nr:hypothetical protein H2200_013055 [Cladophialophora chaetospira]